MKTYFANFTVVAMPTKRCCALQGFGCLIPAVVHTGATLLILIQISVEHIENVHIVTQ